MKAYIKFVFIVASMGTNWKHPEVPSSSTLESLNKEAKMTATIVDNPKPDLTVRLGPWMLVQNCQRRKKLVESPDEKMDNHFEQIPWCLA